MDSSNNGKDDREEENSTADGVTNTQVCSTDSSSYGDEFEDGDNDENCPFRNAMKFDETVPLEDDFLFETQLVKEDANLGDETQVLEDQDSIDEYKTDVILDSDAEGTDRTEVLTDDDQVCNDVPVLYKANDFDYGRENGGSENGPSIPASCTYYQAGRGFVADSDASTDEACSSGHQISSALQTNQAATGQNAENRHRSFTSVRTASLQSSGPATSHSRTSKVSDAQLSATLTNNQPAPSQENFEVPYTVSDAIRGDAGITSFGDQTSSFVNIKDQCSDDTRGRIKNARARKLFTECTPADGEGVTNKSDSVPEITDTPQLLVCDHAFAGLSYVGSQEPGEFSQANALGVVDKVLAFNDMEHSQHDEPKITPGEKSCITTPVSSAKGPQSLAKRPDLRSPVVKEGIFDWIDSHEDEGGGDFFGKKQDEFFESTVRKWKSHTEPRKPKRLKNRTTGVIDQCGANQKASNPQIHQKIMGLTHSDLRLMLNNSVKCDNLQISETKAKKKILKELDERLAAEPTEHQAEKIAISRNTQDTYDVGPDTQLAAEAMEALVCGPPTNHESVDAHLEGRNLTKVSNGSARKNKAGSKYILRNRACSSSDSEGDRKESKRRNMTGAKLRRKSSYSSRKSIKDSRSKDLGQEPPVKTNLNKQKKNHEQNLRIGIFCNGQECSNAKSSKVTKRRRSKLTSKGTCIKVLDGCHNPLASNGHERPEKEHLHGNVTCVAPRTRNSKLMSPLTRMESSLNDFVANASKSLRVQQDCSEILQHQNGESEKDNTIQSMEHGSEVLYDEKHKTSCLTKAALDYPKRRRTRRINEIDRSSKLNGPSMVNDAMLEAKACSTWRKRSRVDAGNIFVCSDTVRRITRSAFAVAKLPSSSSGINMMPKPGVSSCPSPNKATCVLGFRSDPCLTSKTDTKTYSGKVPKVSGIRTRSSGNSHPTVVATDNNSKNSMASQKFSEKLASDAPGTSSTVMSEEKSPRTKDLITPSSDVSKSTCPRHGASSVPAAEDATLDESVKEKIQTAGTPCITPISNDMASPICMGNEPHIQVSKKGLSKSSLKKELIRLEVPRAAPIPVSNDVRKRRDMDNVCILFSHHLGEDIIKQQKKILARLGVSIASTPTDATHFVTDKFARTRNMLEAIALGKPVVTHLWLESCGQASYLIDEKNYILRDLKKEKEIGFNMPSTLARARQSPLLQGKRVFISPTVKPNREVVASLVKAVQGQALERIGRSILKDDNIPDDLLILSCEEDYTTCMPLIEKGAEIYSSELLLNGIVIQKLEFERHRIFLDRVKRTRSTIWMRKEDANQFHSVSKCT